MTIIEPNKNKYYASEFLFLGALLLVFAVLNIYFYNLNVSLKFQIGLQEKAAQKLEVVNADLRNDLYAVLDSKNLSELARNNNFVTEKNPDYLENKTLAKR